MCVGVCVRAGVCVCRVCVRACGWVGIRVSVRFRVRMSYRGNIYHERTNVYGEERERERERERACVCV